jgi:multiple sugar transport system permease protein
MTTVAGRVRGLNRRGPTSTFFGYLGLIVATLVFVTPLIWAVSASLSSQDQVFANTKPFTWRAFLPTDPSAIAYRTLFSNPQFVRSLLNSVVLSLATVLIGVLIAGLAGFAFARFTFRGKNVAFAVVVFTFMLPLEAIVIPLFKLVTDLHWNGSWLGLTVPGLANGVVIFLFRQFFADFPDEIIEAARLDGANWPRVMRSIVLPLAWPVIISASLWLFILTWNSFFWPLVIAPTEDLRVIQVQISTAISDNRVDWPSLFAGSLIATVVPVLLVLPLQKYFMQSIATEGTKG